MMKYLFFNSNKPKRFFCSIGDRKLIIIALIFLSLLAGTASVEWDSVSLTEQGLCSLEQKCHTEASKRGT